MTAVYRLAGSAYQSYPSENMVHSHFLFSISSPSTVDNEGGGWLATGPIGSVSGFAFSSYVESTNQTKRAVNRALVADMYMFYQTGDRLFRLDCANPQDDLAWDGFNANYWEIVHTFTNMEAGRTGRNTGIYSFVTQPSTTGVFKRYIVGAYNSTVSGANTWKGFRYDIDSNTTTETSAVNLGFNAPATAGAVKAEIFYNNRLYFIANSNTLYGIFDPVTMTLVKGSFDGDTTIRGPHDFCPFNGKLYLLNRSNYNEASSTSGIYIHEVRGSQTEVVFNFAVSGIGIPGFASEQTEPRCLLFTDRQYLYAGIYSNKDSGGTYDYIIHRLGQDSNGNFYYIDRPLDAPYDPGYSTYRATVFLEQNTHPDIAGDGDDYGASVGQLITINTERAGTTGTFQQQKAWGGPSGPLVDEESLSGWILHALRCTARAHCKNGGGERIWNPAVYGSPRVDITGYDYGSRTGTVTVEFEIFHNYYFFHAGTPVTVQLRYSTQNHMPFSRGRLLNPSVGTLSENDTVLSIPASASGTTYSVEWDYGYHGINPRSMPLVNLLISTTGVA